MTGRTPAAAVHNFRDVLQQAVSCVTTSVLVTSSGGHVAAPLLHGLAFGGGPARLTGDAGIQLRGENSWLTTGILRGAAL